MMNTTKLITQFKRELWENKAAFIYAPAIATLLLLLTVGFAVIKFSGVDSVAMNFNDTDGFEPAAINITNFLSKVSANGGQVYSEIIKGVTYVNSALLFIVFFIVILGYSHSCLFDDRKNRDILFWRSMPVSETSNVLVKLGVVVFYFPIVIFVLNAALAVAVLVLATTYFAANGIAISSLLLSIIQSDVVLTLLKALFVSLLNMVLLLPVITFFLLASSYAKKSPFLTSSLVPAVLVVMDKVVNDMTGINLHIVDACVGYWQLLNRTHAMVELGEVMYLGAAGLTGYIILALVAASFTAGAIWLRNNRYEI